MKILKIILGLILSLILIVLIAGLFLPKEMKILQTVTINKSSKEIFHYIRSLKNQNNFSVWALKDPNMKISFTGIDGTVGSTSKWEGNSDVGQGEQEIKSIQEGRRVDFELRFKKPMEDTNTAFMTTDSIAPNQTKVSWGFQGNSPYPMNVMTYLMTDMLNKQLGDGLINLKKIMEK